MSQWYFAQSGRRSGPVSRAELDARIAEGEVRGDTLVWRPGMDAWLRADAVAELAVPPALPLQAGSAEQSPLAEEAVAAPVAPQWRPEYAGIRLRLSAKILDLLVLLGAGQLVEAGVARWVFGGILPVPPDWDGFWHSMLWLLALNTAVALLFSVYFILRHEATPGKILLGLRVVRSDGGRLGAGRIVARYWAEQLSGLTMMIGYVMALFDDEKRTLHDYLCRTRVVRGRRRPEDPE